MGYGIRKSAGDRIFDIVNMTLLFIITLAVFYPLYYVIISSISDPNAVNSGRVILFPVDITFSGYKTILRDTQIWSGYRNTVLYTFAGTSINITLTMTAAFALSRKKLFGRTFIMMLIVFTMYFSGGLIPRYLVVKQLGLLNSIGAMVLPGAVGAWNLIITRTFLQNTISEELFDAAFIDGCSDFRVFVQIVLPLSSTVIAMIALFYGVGHWNSFFDALIYLRSQDKYPLQIILRRILILAQTLMSSGADADTANEQIKAAEQVKFGVIIVATVPMLMIYPFVQKYFVKGVMVGGLKG